MPDLTVKFDGGRMAVLDENRRIVGHIGEWLAHHDTQIKERAWEEGARSMVGSHAAQIKKIIEDAICNANPYSPSNKPTTNAIPLIDKRETAWRIRHPNVARSPLYDHGWQDALANLGEFMIALRAIHERIPGRDSHGKPYATCKTCLNSYEEPHDWPCPTGKLLEEAGQTR